MLELSIALSYFFTAIPCLCIMTISTYNAIMFEKLFFYFFTAKICLGNNSKTATGKANGFGAVYD